MPDDKPDTTRSMDEVPMSLPSGSSPFASQETFPGLENTTKLVRSALTSPDPDPVAMEASRADAVSKGVSAEPASEQSFMDRVSREINRYFKKGPKP